MPGAGILCRLPSAARRNGDAAGSVDKIGPDGRPMTRKMLIESDPHETRIAVLEEDRLTEIFVERRHHRGVVGNVYKGRVTRVLPGMQAAFVDIGLERDAFLYVTDVYVGDPAWASTGDDEGELAAVGGDEDDGARRERARPPSSRRARSRRSTRCSRSGQEILVQVTKDPLPNKGARVTTQVTLPGRFLVSCRPSRTSASRAGSRTRSERLRLRALLEAARAEGSVAANGGVIVRTAGEGRSGEEFAADLAYLAELWERRRASAPSTAGAPSLVHQDFDLALRVVRDLSRPSSRSSGSTARRPTSASSSSSTRCSRSSLREVRLDQPEKSGGRASSTASASSARSRRRSKPQGLAQVGRLPRDQPDRGAGRDRRQHRPLSSASTTSRRRCSPPTSRRSRRWCGRSGCATSAASS